MKLFEFLKPKQQEKGYRRYANLINSYVAGRTVASPENYYSLVRAYTQWVYTCATKNAQNVAKQKLRLYVAKPRGSKSLQPTAPLTYRQKEYIYDTCNYKAIRSNQIEVEEILTHPFLDLMRFVNVHSTQYELMFLSQLFDELTGNDYWYMTFNGLRVPSSLQVIPSQGMTIIPDKSKLIAGYEYTNDGGEKLQIPVNKIVHTKFPNPDNILYGKAPLAAVTSSVNISSSDHTYQQAIFDNAGILAGYFTTENNLHDDAFDRLDQSLDEYRGKKNAGKTPLFDNGLEYKAIAVNPKDIFNAISGKKSMEEIAAAFGVPMSLLTPENTNRANADAANYAYQRDTIHPRLIMREQKINEKIMPLYDPKLFCMFDNPVMEDNEAVRKKIESGTKIGLFTINESRRMFGEQDSADPNANRRLVPMNYCYADRLDEVIDNSKMKPGDKPGGENNEREE